MGFAGFMGGYGLWGLMLPELKTRPPTLFCFKGLWGSQGFTGCGVWGLGFGV